MNDDVNVLVFGSRSRLTDAVNHTESIASGSWKSDD